MLRTFFTRQLKEDAAPKISKTERGVPYDPGLITALTHQHRELVLLLVKASSTAEQCYFAETAETLAQFETDLDTHLRRESAQLVPYLAAHLRGEDATELVRDMRTNGALIERTVQSFLDYYRHNPVDAESMQEFVTEIERVCEEFCQEIEREESAFYTLYMTPDAY
jgi:iron-sulfur cluster repair protein YtfE (RIC family)